MRWFLMIGFVAGCFELDAPPRPPSLLATNVDDDAPFSPTGTLRVQLSAPVDPGSLDALALVRGEAAADLVAALAKPPLAARYLAQVVALTAQAEDDLALLTPRRALDPSARYTLVVGAALRAGTLRLDRPSQRGFTTGTLDEAAPILQLVTPSDGAAGVVRNLRVARLRWSKPMPSVPLELIDDQGQRVSSRTVLEPDGIALILALPLDAGRHYTVRAQAGLADGEGRPPFGDPPGFSTGHELRTSSPRLDGLTLEAADRCLVARFASDRTVSAQLCVGDRCARDSDGDAHAIGVSLAELKDGWTLRAWDDSSAPEADRDGLVEMPPVPLVLTEVLFEPRGPRLPQQFVELYNVGDDAVELGGLELHTASGFDALPAATLPSGGYAVVVPSGFITDGADVAPAASALLLHVANTRLGGRGIRIGGEPVWLQTPDGQLITRWGGFPVEVAAGQSLSRLPYECDLPSSFRPGPATPGAP